jgi:hypothetical protein
MNHAITISGLLLSLGVLIGLAATGLGVLMVFAGGMSDAPAEGDGASSIGCAVAGGGVALLVICLIHLVA